jgi:hypothetical protein
MEAELVCAVDYSMHVTAISPDYFDISGTEVGRHPGIYM